MLSIDCGEVISVLEFSCDSSKLFIQGHTQVRNPLDGKLIGGPITGAIGEGKFLPDGKSIALSDGDDGWVYILGTTLKSSKQIEFPEGDPSGDVWFTSTGKQLLSFGWSSEKDVPVLELRSASKWKISKSWELFEDENQKYADILVSPDDKFFFGVNNEKIECRSMQDASEVWSFEFDSSPNDFLKIQFRPGHKQLVVGGEKFRKVLDQDTGEELSIFKSKKKIFTSAVSAKELALLCDPSSGASSIMFVDLESGKTLRETPSPSGKLFAVVYSPNGKWIAVGGKDKKAYICDVGEL